MPAPRVRFAPSPTGYLHIGGARTALFNWLWARRTGGKFVLRIEDTDRDRSTEESVQAILDGMLWMGLDWDEGPLVTTAAGTVVGGGPHAPYFQTQRLATYEQHADALIAKGRAYRCVCTKAELDVLREQARAEKRGFKYPGTCRDRGIAKGTKGAVVRFRMPSDGSTTLHDLVKGDIVTQNAELQDEVIVREGGVPLYNFGAVVDDVEMGITLVARGDDHVVNTPRQMLMYQALDYPVPVFAHLPMILGKDKQRLSKRHGAVSVLQYREEGYLPGALLNYLVRLGWSHGDEEIFTLEDLKAKFDWEHVGATAGVFNPEKLLWLNQEWIKRTPVAELAALVRSLRPDLGQAEHLDGFIELMKERAKTLLEFADAYARLIAPAQVDYDPKSVAKNLTAESKPLLAEARALLAARFDDGAAALDAAFRDHATQKGLGLGKILQPLRVATTGSTVSPPLFELLSLVGRERTLARLDAALERIA